MENQLQQIEIETHNVLEKSHKSFACISNALDQLKAFLLGYTFCDENEEIRFFKEIKPSISAKSVFHKRIMEIESLRPTGTYEVQINYLKKQLEELTRFFNEHKEFYQYYRMKSTLLDNVYFTRKNNRKPKGPDIDGNAITSHDYVVAKIIAHDWLEIYLKEEIEKISLKLEKPNSVQVGCFSENSLQWTGNKTWLIELIYALCACGVLNNGKCEIREITQIFEKTFNIQLTDTIYRTYVELKTRSNPTKFLDKLRNSFLRKIEEDC